MGYTPNLVVGAWAGNNNNTSIDKKVAGMVIAPMWRAFMDEALPSFPKEYFTSPEPTTNEIKPVFRGVWQGYDSFIIDKISNKLATDLTPEETRQEVFLPNVHEILYWVNKDDPWGAVPENPADDPQFKHWEYPVQEWLKTQYLPTPIKPVDYDDVHTEKRSPKINIIDPNQNSTYDRNQKITVQTSNQSTYPISKLDFYINSTYVGSANQTPFLFSFVPADINSIGSENTLKIVATDSVYNRSEVEMNFFITE